MTEECRLAIEELKKCSEAEIIKKQTRVLDFINSIKKSIYDIELKNENNEDRNDRIANENFIYRFESLLYRTVEDPYIRHLIRSEEEVVLCVRNRRDTDNTEEDKILLGRDKIPWKTRIKRITNDTKSIHKAFPKIVPIPRIFVEGNPHYRQLCVGILLTQGDKLVLLQNTDKHRLANKISLIQGHVDLPHHLLNDFENMECNLITYLERTVYKELNEEIGGLDVIQFQSKLMDIICSNDNAISKEHLGFIFNIELPEYINISKLTSKEPEKHKIFIADEVFIKSSLFNIGNTKKEDIDEWLKHTFLRKITSRSLEAGRVVVEKIQLTNEQEEKLNSEYIQFLKDVPPATLNISYENLGVTSNEVESSEDSNEEVVELTDEEMEFCQALKVLMNNPYTKDFIYCAENAVKDEKTGKWVLPLEEDKKNPSLEVSDGLECYEMLDSLSGRNVLSGLENNSKEVAKMKNNMTPPPVPEGPQFRVIDECFSNLFNTKDKFPEGSEMPENITIKEKFGFRK